MSLRRKIIDGVFWQAACRCSGGVAGLLVLFVLIRLLDPEDFGLVAIAAVFTTFLGVFVDQGLTEAIVQRQEIDPEYLDTVFWLNIAIGTLLTVAGVVFSGVIGALFDDSRLTPIVVCMSPTFLLLALSNTQQALLRRAMNFRVLAFCTLAAKIIGGGCGVTAALMGFGAWSLVIQSISAAAAGVVVLWVASDWRPRLGFSRKYWRESAGFGFSILGVRVLNGLDRSADNLLIGYFLGPVLLGYYSVAYRLVTIIGRLLSSITSEVLMPAFSTLQSDTERLRKALYEAVLYAALVSVPLFLGIAVVGPELVETVYGPKWSASIPVLQVLAVGAIPIAIMGIHGSLIISMGRPDSVLRIRVATTIVRMTAFILVVRFGIVAVSLAFVASTYAFTPWYLWLTRKMVRFEISTYLNHVYAPITSGIVMSGAVLLLKWRLQDLSGPHWLLLECALLGAAVYLVSFAILKPGILSNVLRLSRVAISRQNRQAT